MGLTLEACVNDTCAFKMPIFNNSEIPGTQDLNNGQVQYLGLIQSAIQIKLK